MSFNAIRWALSVPVEKPSQRLVLVALANFADNTQTCFPSVSKISEITLLDRKAIYRALEFLDNKELITVFKEVGKPNQYKLNTSAQRGTTNQCPNGDVPKKALVPKEAQDQCPNGTTTSAQRGTLTSKLTNQLTSNEKENIKEKEDAPTFELTPVEKPSRRKSLVKPDNVTQQTWDDFNAIRKAKKAPLTQTALVRIQNEADKAGIELETALQICCVRGWQSFNHTWDWQDKTVSTQKRQPETREPDFSKIDYGESGLLSDFKF